MFDTDYTTDCYVILRTHLCALQALYSQGWMVLGVHILVSVVAGG